MSKNSAKIDPYQNIKHLIINNRKSIKDMYRGFESRLFRQDKKAF